MKKNKIHWLGIIMMAISIIVGVMAVEFVWYGLEVNEGVENIIDNAIKFAAYDYWCSLPERFTFPDWTSWLLFVPVALIAQQMMRLLNRVVWFVTKMFKRLKGMYLDVVTPIKAKTGK